MADPEVLVIGAGLAGISAALELRRQGRTVRLFEAAARAGGCVSSVDTPHGPLPRGPTTFSGRHQVMWDVLEALSLSSEAVLVGPAAKTRYIVRDGTLRGIQQSPISLLTSRALTLSDRLAVFRERNVPPSSGPEESLGQFFRRRFGAPFTDALADAMISGIWAGDPDTLGAETCLPQLVGFERTYGSVVRGAMKSARADGPGKRGIFRLNGGLGRIADRAREVLDVTTAAEVEKLTRSGNRWVLHFGGFRQEANSVVIATAAPAAAALLAPHLAPAAKVLRGCRYAPMTLVHWRGDSKFPQGLGYLGAEREKLFALGTLFQGDIEGAPLRWFTSFVGGTRHPDKASLSNDALRAGVAGDVNRLTGGSVDEVLHVERWERAVFQPPVGHAAQLVALQQSLSGSGLSLAGSYLGAGAMADAIHSGVRAAQQLGSAHHSKPITGDAVA